MIPGLTEGEEAVALMHAGWNLAVPLLGYWVAGHVGLWICGGLWLVANAVQQRFFHGLYNNAKELPTDLATKIAPCTALLALDVLRYWRWPCQRS